MMLEKLLPGLQDKKLVAHILISSRKMGAMQSLEIAHP